jgi:YVTN family beta-propeller protein
MGRRLALLVATYEHDDPGLRQLTSPAADAEAFAAVLRDGTIAGFEVTVLVNEPHYRVGEAIADLYRDRRRDDLTLLYFTGHGLKDDDGRLYLATTNTRRDSLLFTSLPAEQIDYAMEGCTSRQKILILDCCYSGAFPQQGAKGDTDVHALERFRGRGRTILTASDSLQYSFEGNPIGGSVQSIFTRHLVEGLRDGSADLDGDGDITVDELYTYVYDHVVEELPQQRPKKLDNVEGRTVIARNIGWSMPVYLRNSLNSPITADRLSGLDGLLHLHRIGNDSVRAQVVAEFDRLAHDDSRAVSTAAAAQLAVLRPADTASPVGAGPPRSEPASEPPPVTAESKPVITGQPSTPLLDQNLAIKPDPQPAAEVDDVPPTMESNELDKLTSDQVSPQEPHSLAAPVKARSAPEVTDDSVIEIGNAQPTESVAVEPWVASKARLPELSCLSLALTYFLISIPLDSPDLAPTHVMGWATIGTATIGLIAAIIERKRSRLWLFSTLTCSALCTLYGIGLAANNALPSRGMGAYILLAVANGIVFVAGSRIPYLIGIQNSGEAPETRPPWARPLLLWSSAAAIAFTVALLSRSGGAAAGFFDPLLLWVSTGALTTAAVASVRRARLSSDKPSRAELSPPEAPSPNSVASSTPPDTTATGSSIAAVSNAGAATTQTDKPAQPTDPTTPANTCADARPGQATESQHTRRKFPANIPWWGWTAAMVALLGVAGLVVFQLQQQSAGAQPRAFSHTIAFDEKETGPNPVVTNLTLSPDGQRLYAATGDQDSLPETTRIFAIDTNPNAITGVVKINPTLDVAISPEKLRADVGLLVAPDGRRVYVARADGAVVVIDAREMVYIDLIPVAAAVGHTAIGQMALAPDGNHLYATTRNQDSGATSLSVVDVASKTVTATIDVQARSLAVSPDGRHVYAARLDDIAVIDTATNTIVASISAAPDGSEMVVAPDGLRLYFVRGSEMLAIDTATNSVANTIFVGQAEGSSITAAADNTRVYLSVPTPDHSSGAVLIEIFTGYGTQNRTLVDFSPYLVEFAPDGSRAYAPLFAFTRGVGVIEPAWS